MDIFRELVGRVALGIDADEQRLHRLARGPQSVDREADRQQIGRADVGTEGEAEIDQHQLAAKIGIGARLAGVIDQLERTADRLLAPHHRVHHFAGRALARLLREQRRRRSPDNASSEPRSGTVAAPRARNRSGAEGHAAAGGRDQYRSGICCRIAGMKLLPLQCMGITTSGSSFLISATTWLR